MPLEHRWPTKLWYARIDVFENSRLVPLRVLIPSKPPPRGELGDEEFEKYRFLAKDRLELLEAAVSKAKTPGEAEGIIEDSVSEWKPPTKRKRSQVSKKLGLVDLGQAWLDAPSKAKRDPEKQYVKDQIRLIDNFVEFVRNRSPRKRFCYQVDFDDAEQFAKMVKGAGLSPKRYGDTVKGLRSVFRSLKRRIGFQENPFSEIPIPEKSSVQREVFSIPQLQAMFILAKDDEFSGPLIVAGACTSMRLGDCACLKWEHIDLKGKRISVVCRKSQGRGKNKGRAYIPMMRPLLELIGALRRKGVYVFPEQQAMYAKRPSDVSYRVNRFIDRVGESLQGTEDYFERKAKREDGKRMASVLGFAAFRTTWITLAAMAGVPDVLIKRVTGHSNVDMILNHYFNPNGEDVNLKITMKMSPIFEQFCGSSEIGPSKEGNLQKAIAVIESIDEENWEANKAEALALLALLSNESE